MSDKIRVNLTLKDTMVSEIDFLCERLNVPRATLCQIIIKRGLDEMVADEGEKIRKEREDRVLTSRPVSVFSEQDQGSNLDRLDVDEVFQ